VRANESASERGEGEGGTVMAAIDDGGASARLVIADVSRDDAWLSVQESEAPALGEWR